MKIKEVTLNGHKSVIEYDRKSSLVWLRKKDRHNISAKRYALTFEMIRQIADEIYPREPVVKEVIKEVIVFKKPSLWDFIKSLWI